MNSNKHKEIKLKNSIKIKNKTNIQISLYWPPRLGLNQQRQVTPRRSTWRSVGDSKKNRQSLAGVLRDDLGMSRQEVGWASGRFTKYTVPSPLILICSFEPQCFQSCLVLFSPVQVLFSSHTETRATLGARETRPCWVQIAFEVVSRHARFQP